MTHLLLTWQLDPAVWAAAGLSLGGFFWLYRRSRPDRSRAPWPARQTALFTCGVLIVVLALESPLDALAEDLFWAHMLQHMLLLVIAPPLLVLGTPATALLRALPRAVRYTVVRPLVRRRLPHRAGALVFHPLTVSLVFNGALGFWHLPSFYTAALEQPVWHSLEHASYLFAGCLLWWLIVEPWRVWPRGAGLSKIVFVAATHLPMLLLGQLFLAFATVPLYPANAAQETAWGLTALADQRLGGGIMVGLDMLITFATISVLFGRFLSRLEQQQRALEELPSFKTP